MGKLLLKPIDLCGRLNAAIRLAGGVPQFARLHNLKVQAVRDTQSLKSISEDVTKAVGLVPVLRYPVRAQAGRLATLGEVQEKLNSFVAQRKTQRAAAMALGVSEGCLSNIQNARRGFTPVLVALGFDLPVTRFVVLP
ncbi:MAG: hypothetical protein ABF567_05385 [Acetobacter okinawensis]